MSEEINVRKGFVIRQNDGRLDQVSVNVNDNKAIVKILKGIKVNGIQFPELEDYGYKLTVWSNVIKKKTDRHNSKASKLATKKVFGDVLVVDSGKDLEVTDYNKILQTLADDAQMKQEAFEKAKTDAIAEAEAEKLMAREKEEAGDDDIPDLVASDDEDAPTLVETKTEVRVEEVVEEVEEKVEENKTSE